MKKKQLIIVLFIFQIFCLGLNLLADSHMSEAEKPLEKVSLQLRWFSQFQFAGYYAALEKGYYKEAGLDVTIKEVTYGMDVNAEILEGHSEYGVGTTNMVLDRAKGKPLVVLAVIFQHSPLILLTRADSGIRTPQDLEGKTLMIRHPDDVQTLTMIHNEGVSFDKINIVEHTYNYEDLINKKVDAATAFSTTQPKLLLEHGVEPYSLKPLMYGIDFYGDSLFTSEFEIKNHPGRVKAFRDASLKGWTYAMSHKEEMINLLKTKYNSQVSHDRLRYEAKAMDEIVMPKLVQIGHINPWRWKRIADTFVTRGMLEPDYNLSGFLYDPNPKKDYSWIYQLLAIMLVGLVLLSIGAIALVLFNRRLQTAVEEHTRKLKNTNSALIEEISERKQAEKRLNEYQEHLEELVEKRTVELVKSREEAIASNKAKSTFLANMSHEIRTPLNSIVGFSQILLKKSKSMSVSKEFQGYLEVVQNNGNILTELVNNILNLAKIEAGKLGINNEVVNLKLLINSIVRSVKETVDKKSLQLSSTVDSDLPDFIIIDRTKVNQILINLIGNSVKFTEEGKKVDLQVREEEGKLLLKVVDEGIGIPEMHQNIIFDAFEQGDQVNHNDLEGTGLGLSITKNIVRLLNGRIELKSTEGKGTTFYVWLPLVAARKEETYKATMDWHRYEFSGKSKVLIVEDQECNRKMIDIMFRELNVPVMVLTGGREAVEYLTSKAAEGILYDLVLMDINMPGLNGLDAIQMLKSSALTQTIPIVAFSANAFEEQQEEAIKAGAAEYLVKPLLVNKLLPVLTKFLPYSHDEEREHLSSEMSDSWRIKMLGQMKMLNELILERKVESALDLILSSQKDCSGYETMYGEFLKQLASFVGVSNFKDAEQELSRLIGAMDRLKQEIEVLKEIPSFYVNQIQEQVEKILQIFNLYDLPYYNLLIEIKTASEKRNSKVIPDLIEKAFSN